MERFTNYSCKKLHLRWLMFEARPINYSDKKKSENNLRLIIEKKIKTGAVVGRYSSKYVILKI